eukprot:252044_1
MYLKKQKNDDNCFKIGEEFTWTITDGTLTSFYTYKPGQQYINSPTFTLCNLKWKIDIYPNGYQLDTKGSFKIYIELLSMPKTAQNIIVCRTIRCDEPNIKITNICQYKKSVATGWKRGTLLLNEIKQKQYKSLTFRIRIKILQINFNTKKQLCNPNRDATYPKKFKVKWKLSGNVMKTMKESTAGKKYESKMFHDMWCLQCMPNKRNYMRIYLQLTGLPMGSKSVLVQYRISFKEIDSTEIGSHEFDYKKTWKNTETKLLSFDRFKRFDTLTIYAKIEVLKEFDMNGENITLKQNGHEWNNWINEQKNNECIGNKKIIGKYKDSDDEMKRLQHRSDKMHGKINKLLVKTRKYNNNNEHSMTEYSRTESFISDYSQSIKSNSNQIHINQIYERMQTLQNKLDIIQCTHGISKTETHQVYVWLEKLNLMQYYNCFIDNGFGDLETIMKITTKQQLIEIGIDKLGHRIKIFNEIKDFKPLNN